MNTQRSSGHDIHDLHKAFPRILSESEFNRFLGGDCLDVTDGGRPMERFIKSVKTPERLDEVLENVFSFYGTRLMEADLGKQLTKRHRELCGQPRDTCLSVCVGLEVISVAIPDSSRDEMLFHMEITTGADTLELLDFMVQQNLLAEETAEELEKCWCKSDAIIGQSDVEARILNKCLGVDLDNTISYSEKSITYNYGEMTKKIWRCSRVIANLCVALDFSKYPFDESFIVLTMHNSANFDASECILCPDPTSKPSANFEKTSAPRGCNLLPIMPDLEMFVESPGEDSLPQAAIRTAFELRRTPDMLIWRTFIPALVILLMGFSAAFAVVLFGARESILTQVLPALLIANVALQLTAAQHMPSHSGRTTMDKIFVLIYSLVIALYIGSLLVTFGVRILNLIAVAILSGASFLFVGVAFMLIVRYHRSRR